MGYIFTDSRVDLDQSKKKKPKIISNKRSKEVFGYGDKPTKKPTWNTVVLGTMK